MHITLITVYLSALEVNPNITTNNTEILISTIGEDVPGGLPSLTCHTDLENCCRSEGLGEWFYPDGRVVQNNSDSTTARESFYRVRNAPQVIRLARRVSSHSQFSPTGSYCCVIPTTAGEMNFCANIGIERGYSYL